MGGREKKSKDRGRVTSKNKETVALNLYSRDAIEKHYRRSARLAALQTDATRNAQSSVEATQPQPSSTSGNFIMKMATAFPSTVIVNKVMPLPVVVLFGREQEDIPHTDDVWVFVSLIEGSSGDSALEDLLQGQKADSVHIFTAHQANLQGNFAYASFPNLLIARSGQYRLRVTAIDMKRYA